MALQVFDKHFEPYITAQQITEQIAKLAGQINTDYKDKRPL